MGGWYLISTELLFHIRRAEQTYRSHRSQGMIGYLWQYFRNTVMMRLFI